MFVKKKEHLSIDDGRTRLSVLLGESGEITEGTLYQNNNPICSFTTDLSQYRNFGCLGLFCSGNDIRQMVGYYYHSGVGEFTRRSIGREIVRLLLLKLKGVKTPNVHFYGLEYKQLRDGTDIITDGEIGLFKRTAEGEVVLMNSVASYDYGKSTEFLSQQVNDFMDLLIRDNAKIRYPKNRKLTVSPQAPLVG